jgi:hypothetical protein
VKKGGGEVISAFKVQRKFINKANKNKTIITFTVCSQKQTK